ncbi:hypothetical protein [Methanosarcina sp.]|uniref:hypothetical protein n=1 Tax=Methanosarcina sp. TaxID=2213 RepID=UPI002988BAD7|nr:hypothetical protein [Methanosarcina sp.]MDW5552292.1 hypothetical protein [Methanosarcina sp.]
MPFNFESLDLLTRQFMKQELDYDQKNNRLYISSRLNERGVQLYPELLRKAIDEGNDITFGIDLLSQGCFNEHVLRNGKPTKMPSNAHETLSEGEFNRFYIRALCLRSINEGRKLEVYRAKQVSDPRPDSQMMIGRIIDATSSEAFLNDLRTNIGVDTAFGLPNGPNSGLSVRIKQ